MKKLTPQQIAKMSFTQFERICKYHYSTEPVRSCFCSISTLKNPICNKRNCPRYPKVIE